MDIKFFKTLWGFAGDISLAAAQAAEAGFHGLEGQAAVALGSRGAGGMDYLVGQLAAHKLDYIAEICACGSYVPERRATPAEHLADIKAQILGAAPLQPRFFTILAGCDAWPLEVQTDFFRRAVDLAADLNVVCSFETHRSRSFFNPWTTAAVAAQVPGLLLTLDISHWVVVCERLLDTDWETLAPLFVHVHHIHSRVGYPQGPQVPHPAALEYAPCLDFHQRCWEAVWTEQQRRGYATTTMTPEFGPDGYLHTLPFTDMPVADLWEINRWMAKTEQNHYRRFMDIQNTPSQS